VASDHLLPAKTALDYLGNLVICSAVHAGAGLLSFQEDVKRRFTSPWIARTLLPAPNTVTSGTPEVRFYFGSLGIFSCAWWTKGAEQIGTFAPVFEQMLAIR
jgi:hypothetical protein